MYEYRAKVLRVIDGDTLHLAIDMGLETTRLITVRLYSINCPEMRDIPAGPWAKIYTEEWVKDHADADGYVQVHTIKDKKEKYGRYLAIIFPLDEPIDQALNDALVADGHAVYKDY